MTAVLNRPRVWPGQPYPLGAHWDGRGVNFALFSLHAEKVELCLFDAAGRRETARRRRLIPMPRPAPQGIPAGARVLRDMGEG